MKGSRITALCLLLLLTYSAECGTTEAVERSDQDTIEDASGLIKELIAETEQQIKDLKDYWAETDPILQSAVNAVAKQQQGQKAECDTDQAAVDTTTTDLTNTENYVDWIANRIKENTKKVTDLDEHRCDASKLYIESIKHNKIALSLIAFLRKAIEQRDDLSLAQRGEIFKRLMLFMQMYHDNRIKELIQTSSVFAQDGDDTTDYSVTVNETVKARNSSEIGTGHIDSGKEEIKLKDFDSSKTRNWPQYKADLLTLLDSLEEQIKTQSERAQDDEVNAGVSLAEFKIQIEQENRDLDRYLYEEQVTYGQLKASLEKETTVLTACLAQLEVVDAQLTDAQAHYKEEEDDYESKKKELAEQLETFKYVQVAYRGSVEDQSDKYRDSINDIIKF